MFIRDWRDWKNNIRRILGLGVFNFVLLFVMGYQLFLDFIGQITSRQLNMQSSRFEDLSISGFTYFLSEGGLGIPAQYASLIGMLILVLSGIIIFGILAHVYKNENNRFNPYLLLVCTLAALIIPAASFDYKLPILAAPMILLLTSLPKVNNISKKAFSIVLVISISTAYWSTLYPYSVKNPIFFRNSPALLVILFSTAILYLLLKGKFENIITRTDPDDH
jgi:hypothetical protein